MAETELAGPSAGAEPGGPSGPAGGGSGEAAGAGGVPEARSETAGEAGPSPGETQPAGQDTPAAQGGRRRTVLWGVGIGLLLLAVVVLGFAGYLYGLSGVQEARSQAILHTRFRTELAGGLAPVGATALGSPVAILDIPGIGVRNVVVVEGTSPEVLMTGPGHLPDTPLPGQPGVSELFGRRATYGGPFARLAQLRPGDIIHAATAQGIATYRVAAVANSTHLIKDPVANRLILVTASSPVIPAYFIEADARLVSRVQPSQGVAHQVFAPELPLAADNGSLTLAMAWGLALALVSAAGTIAAIRWSRPAFLLATVPLAAAVLWNLYESLAALLPNLY